jgi:hypothetical protein
MLVFYTWTVRALAETISLMASTEKIGWMATQTPQEGEALKNSDGTLVVASSDSDKDGKTGKIIVSVDANSRGDGGAPPNWPSRGTIEFENVWMKYLPSAPYALKGESFSLLSWALKHMLSHNWQYRHR